MPFYGIRRKIVLPPIINVMKKYLLIIASILLTIAGIAQNESSVLGSVTDQTSKPVAAATISLLIAKDSSLYKSAVTDNTGSYHFENVKPGKYLVKITSVNYGVWHSLSFDKATSSYKLPVATLITADKKLKEVVVTTTKKPMIEVKAD